VAHGNHRQRNKYLCVQGPYTQDVPNHEKYAFRRTGTTSPVLIATRIHCTSINCKDGELQNKTRATQRLRFYRTGIYAFSVLSRGQSCGYVPGSNMRAQM